MTGYAAGFRREVDAYFIENLFEWNVGPIPIDDDTIIEEEGRATTNYDITPHLETTVAGVEGVYMLSIYTNNNKFLDIGPFKSNTAVTTICGTKTLMSNLGDVSTETPAVDKC